MSEGERGMDSGWPTMSWNFPQGSHMYRLWEGISWEMEQGWGRSKVRQEEGVADRMLWDIGEKRVKIGSEEVEVTNSMLGGEKGELKTAG